jgi:hypothetical protein
MFRFVFTIRIRSELTRCPNSSFTAATTSLTFAVGILLITRRIAELLSCIGSFDFGDFFAAINASPVNFRMNLNSQAYPPVHPWSIRITHSPQPCLCGLVTENDALAPFGLSPFPSHRITASQLHCRSRGGLWQDGMAL